MYSMSTASFTGEVNKVANVAAHAVVNVTLAVAREIMPLSVPQVLPPARWLE